MTKRIAAIAATLLLISLHIVASPTGQAVASGWGCGGRPC